MSRKDSISDNEAESIKDILPRTKASQAMAGKFDMKDINSLTRTEQIDHLLSLSEHLWTQPYKGWVAMCFYRMTWQSAVEIIESSAKARMPERFFVGALKTRAGLRTKR